MDKQKNTILFYDLETTGLSGAFDQVLRFAALRTDLELNELERSEINIRLRADIVPSAGALITNRLSISDIAEGEHEYEAMLKIHSMFNKQGTISTGYNNISFDNEFLRYNFYRNLLDPYLHEWKENCGKMDIMPIALYYYLFKPGAIKWPDDNVDKKLRLENLNAANNLSKGMAHDAMVDVEATVELARKLKQHDNRLWDQLTACFNKQDDLLSMNKLPVIEIDPITKCQIGAMVNLQFGYKQNCIAPVIFLGNHVQYSNQQCWLRLDKIDFNIIANSDDFGKLIMSCVKRKIGQPKFLISIDKTIKLHLGSERTILAEKNLQWIKGNSDLFSILSNEQRNRIYPERENLDLDASLYQSGFFSDEEKQHCIAFHKISNEGKINLIQKLPHARIRELAIRIIGRNYPSLLSEKLLGEYKMSIGKREATNLQGKKRKSLDDLTKEIKKLSLDDDLDGDQISILIQIEEQYCK